MNDTFILHAGSVHMLWNPAVMHLQLASAEENNDELIHKKIFFHEANLYVSSVALLFSKLNLTSHILIFILSYNIYH